MKVWVVAESRFEWYSVKHICGSYDAALSRWIKLRDEMIEENMEMVTHCENEGYSDANDWKVRAIMLQNLKPGERCDCDFPDLKEWTLEE